MNATDQGLSTTEVEAIRRNIRNLTPEEFTNHHIVDRVPYIFSDRKQYVEWKSLLAADLDVDPYTIVIVGSSCLGYSISPTKLFNPFHQRSDIDVAVISSAHFEQAWTWLRRPGVRDMFESKRWQHSFDDHRSRLVFDGAIATDKILNRLPYGPQWARALHRAANREPTTRRTIKARIYKDFEALRTYQISNVRTIKQKLLSED
ncbi:hypothetical protein [Saccharothrix syringae]|uniref:Uncharacterized protein n=1 Tax=Saccharothrix syringae TaxID=103733 RepID=A0A5Q0HCX1_SACSY|nr:hypothetical protein [Saccharothrix syringae]QFZ23824.1 hypothetical protein EKG83_45975 [Saccharothrix syringae]